MIINGDALEVLKRLDDNSIQCFITSPPFYGLRKYGTPPVLWGGDPACEHEWTIVHPPGHRVSDTKPGKLQHDGNKNREQLTSELCKKCGAWRGELGLEPNPDMYVDHLTAICREVRRVLRNDGLFWLNIGDCYWKGKDEGDLKSKDLLEIPSDVAKSLRKDGWYLRARLPWIKRNSFPSSVTDRPAASLEYVFILAKSGSTTFWSHPSKMGTRERPEPDYVYTNLISGDTMNIPPEDWDRLVDDGKGKMIRVWKRSNLWKGHDYFYDGIAVLQKSSESYNRDKRPRGTLRQRVNKNSKYPDEGQFKKQDNTGNPQYTGFNERYAQKMAEAGVIPTRNFRDSDFIFRTWQGLLQNEDGEPIALVVNPRSYKGAHFASFPPQLVEPMIMASTSEKGCCPHCGAPWIRIVDRDPYTYRPTDGSGNQKTDQDPEIAHGLAGTGGHVAVDFTTLRWEATCKCQNNVPEPCSVCDPFGGSGATGVSAKELGRTSIIIELKEEYCGLAEERIKNGK